MPDFIDDYPENVEPMIGATLQLMQTDYSCMTTVPSEVTPAIEQLELQEGDWVLPLLGNPLTEDDLVLARIASFGDHANLFPDWADRATRGWVLVHYLSQHDMTETREEVWRLGWYERARLIPLPEERVPEIRKLLFQASLLNGTTETPPWVHDLYATWVVKLFSSHDADNVLSRPVECPRCGHYELHLHGQKISEMEVPCGRQNIDGEIKWVNLDPNVTETRNELHMELRCHTEGCSYVQPLDEGDWHIAQG